MSRATTTSEPNAPPEIGFDEACRTYLRKHAQKTRLEKSMEPLREAVLIGLRDGKRSPRDLPFMLVLQKRLRTLSDWKDALKQQLKLWLGADEKVNERMESIQAGFAQREDEALVVEINKSYQARIPARKSA